MYKYEENYQTPEWALTPREIRSVKGFENASEEDIELIIKTFALLSMAYFESEINNR